MVTGGCLVMYLGVTCQERGPLTELMFTQRGRQLLRTDDWPEFGGRKVCKIAFGALVRFVASEVTWTSAVDPG